MSAILGVFHRDGRPVEQAALDRMVESLAHCGPDGAGAGRDGPVGLGHRMLRTTPEAVAERMPLAGAEGSLLLTSDARLDNREELIDALDLRGRRSEAIPDGELILAAYEAWGERCPERLLGDFAFGIWDGRRQTLFCARDHFGVRPFYYHLSARLFAFGTEAKAILELPEVPRRLNEVRVAEYLEGLFDDTSATSYEGILRLPPAHRLTVTREESRLERYWSLDPTRELRLTSDEEYAERFRELFTEAVRCRLRSAFPVGALLSGGLDSSSIACVAGELHRQRGKGPFPTFSYVYDDVPRCDERSYIEAVLAHGEFESTTVPGERPGPLGDLDRILWHEDEAVVGHGLSLMWRVQQVAREQGVRVLLEGHDGDNTVSHGDGYLVELARSGRWWTLARELRAPAGLSPGSYWPLLGAYARHYAVEPMMRRSRPARGVRRVWRMMTDHRPSTTDHGPGAAPLLNPEFADRIQLTERRRAARAGDPGAACEREAHYRSLVYGLQPLALEEMAKVSAGGAVERRYPFWDKRLVEYCLSLPPQQKLHQGWSRIVMRRAMAGILPERVRWRRDKCNFCPAFCYSLLRFDRHRLDEVILNDPGIIEPYIDVTTLRVTYERFVSRGQRAAPDDARAIWQAMNVALWLNYSRAFPVRTFGSAESHAVSRGIDGDSIRSRRLR